MKNKNRKRLLPHDRAERERAIIPMCRRGFLKAAASGAVGLFLPYTYSCSSDGTKGEDPAPDSGDRKDAGAQHDAGAGQTCPDCATVGMAKEDDIVRMVRASIDLAGGLSEIKGGDRVVIKPNISGPVDIICTNLEVVRGVIQAMKACTDSRHITVAECSALGFNTENCAAALGFTDLCEQEGVRFLAWDKEGYEGFRDDRWREITEEKLVPQSLNPMSFDHFINVPVLKTHGDAVPQINMDITCCMKNFVGILPYDGEGSRMSPAPLGIHNEYLGEQVAELGCIVPRITMNVVDATTILLQNGPASGELSDYYQAGLVLASKDRVACEAAALAVLKYFAAENNIDRPYVTKSVLEQAQIKRGIELGLGIGDPALIEIIDDGMEEAAGIKEKLS